MKTDEYGEVINDPETYRSIVDVLHNEKRALIGWTDGEHTHLDVLLNLQPPKAGNIQRVRRAVEVG